VADVVAERGPLSEAQTRGVAIHVAGAVARVHNRGIVHGAINPANIVFTRSDDLRLIGAPTTADTEREERDDIVAIAMLAVECATGHSIDANVRWSCRSLITLGCPPALAADLSLVLREASSAKRAGEILQRHRYELPSPTGCTTAIDSSPTIDIPSVAIAGLEPVGVATRAPAAHERRGWRRWAARGPA